MRWSNLQDFVFFAERRGRNLIMCSFIVNLLTFCGVVILASSGVSWCMPMYMALMVEAWRLAPMGVGG